MTSQSTHQDRQPAPTADLEDLAPGARRTGGVLGGLGPLATVEFLRTVVDVTEVEAEQDHVDLIVTQRSSTPDRTAAILGRGPSPAPQMAADAARLQAAGAQFIVVPCNTASYFIGTVAAGVQVPVLSIVDQTVRAVGQRHPGARRLGLMATDGTIASRIYHEAAARAGLEVVVPDEDLQRRVMAMIYDGVKRGAPVAREEFDDCVERLDRAGADVVVAACTEISVLCSRFQARRGKVVDSLEVLARRTVELAGGRLAPL